MPLSWNEIKSRALAFSNEWKDEVSEDAEAKSFWDDFFNVFGISRRRVATFEQQVKKIDNKQGFIDLLWKGVILIEHKSRGKDLTKAYQQAKDYFPGLKEKELPRYILVSDFERFNLYDLETGDEHFFTLIQLVDHVHLFGFIAGYQKRTYKEQDPVNIEAAELMGKLHDKLKAIGYEGHHLEVYLVRLVFLLFADDTNIWEKGIFYDYLDLNTKEDGSDLAAHLAQLFEVLNTPKEKRLRNLDESLAAFPYVNGKLFEEHLPVAGFDSAMRKTLMDCCMLDWGKISPAIFGSLFQSVMDEKARRNLGAHYTSEKNILKVIKPLFLDDLWKEFEAVKDNKAKLQRFHEKIGQLRFLDPACGCGNFLIVAYRELRLLEIEVIKTLLFKHEKLRAEVAASAGIDVGLMIKCDVDRFYGIEYEEFPAQIAQVAMWLVDHQLNQQISEAFGQYVVRLPLRKSAVIQHGNALRIDWQSLLPEGELYDYILGNPPFIGKQLQTAEQKKDMEAVFAGVNGAGVLDYVAAWYLKAAQYMKAHNSEVRSTKTAFVSTNSIAQGEQVSILWGELFNKYGIKIHFAHRTFNWKNEAKGNAAVHVVIIGFANLDTVDKMIYEYEDIKGEPHEVKAKNINPYLVDARDILIKSRKQPICQVQEMMNGSMPNDDGNLILTTEEKMAIVEKYHTAGVFIRKFVGAVEYLNNKDRWCLWLKEVNPSELRKYPEILQRVESVRKFRSNSTREATRKLANYPTLFGEIRQPETDYLIAPVVSSENRRYIPIAIYKKDIIASNLVNIIPDASLYTFGILLSEMMMSWIRTIGGRLKSDWRFTKDNVYNNFPWPENPADKQVKAVEEAAQAVLDARAQFPNSSLADLYDPNTMPPVLVKAHQQLDKAVDQCYRAQPFSNETKRIEFLFELYDKYTAGLFAEEKKKPRKKATI